MMAQTRTEKIPIPFLILVGLAGWIVPGAGYVLLKETARGLIIFVTIILTFVLGIYIGSIGIVDPIGYRLWFFLQMAATPFVAVVGHFTAGGGYPVYGRPCEIGQIYAGTAAWLNLLCIVNTVYMAYLRKTGRLETSVRSGYGSAFAETRVNK